MDNTVLVSTPTQIIGGLSPNTSKKRSVDTTAESSASTSAGEQNEFDSIQAIRKSLENKGVSESVTDIILSSWRSGTEKQYRTYYKKWVLFCNRRNFDPISPTVNNVLEFLAGMYSSGLSYSAINTARSALSNICTLGETIQIGTHPLVKRFMRGVFILRPSLPKYGKIWSVSDVLKYLQTLKRNDISLKELSFKLVMLLALLTGQRLQSLHLLDIRNIELTRDSVTIRIGDLLKQTRPGFHLSEIILKSYDQDINLCVVTAMSDYLDRTSSLRKNETSLFISFVPPHRKVTKDTISRWIKLVLTSANIDINVFKPHSVRAASTSYAAKTGLSIGTILNTAGWSANCTFRKFYNKPIVSNSACKFAEAVLRSSS